MANRRHLIRMTTPERDEFIAGPHTMSVATVNHDGTIHLVAMWYGFLDGAPALVTFSKSQKVRNLRRDPRLSALVEDGANYGELRGVELVGRGTVIDEPDAVLAVARSVVERYFALRGPSERADAAVALARKRSVVRIEAERTVSWDHGKLHGAY